MARMERARDLDWHLLELPTSRGRADLVRDLNRVYAKEIAVGSDGDPAGFQWIDADNARENIVSFIRRSQRREGNLFAS